MIGSSEALKHIQEMIEKVAPSDARVLITGPNGAGERTCSTCCTRSF